LGVAGNWGVGKSSMVKLIQDALKAREDGKFLFVDFNAWLYQGYDDARAALMDVIARRLVAHSQETKTGVERAKELLSRVDLIRLMKLGASAASLALGLPPTGLIGDVFSVVKRLIDKPTDAEALKDGAKTGKDAIDESKSLFREKTPESPPKEIQDLRDHFEATLAEMNITLVVFIDDLDRCMPNTAIATLEAVRLFLFLKNTAFVIAADDKMIRHAVRAHFKELQVDDEIVTSYFDKLIQVPLRVPPLGTQDVRAYLMLLFIENSSLALDVKDDLRVKICRQLGETWQGKRVDRAFVVSLIKDCPPELMSRLETADCLAPLMASARQIAGNPRLIKRFLNTLSIRMSIARAYGITVDESALAKMLLFERCGGDTAFAELVAAINNDDDGKPHFLKLLETKAIAGEKLDGLPAGWDPVFTADWLALPPALADEDLRPAVHVSREHLPLITAADQLTSDAAELLAALFQLKQVSLPLRDKIAKLAKRDRTLVMERLLTRAHQVQEWSNPPILAACMTVAAADPEQADRLAAFLGQLPPQQIRPAVVPLISGQPWAAPVLDRWAGAADTQPTVKKAITTERTPRR
jgi:predicted KAP-like P-loop ATPase